MCLHNYFDPLVVPKVGNAAYHSDYLYDQLKRCIPHLTTLLLGDEEEKTKANAAGALSNLVRNSSKLCEEIISKGAIQVSHFGQLMRVHLAIILYAESRIDILRHLQS